MKIPWYMVLNWKGTQITLTIRRWGWPFLLANIMKQVKFSAWPGYVVAWAWVYPKMCIRALITGGI